MNDDPFLPTGEGYLWSTSQKGTILRWLGASFLLAMMGGGLIGSSIYIALDGRTNTPEAAKPANMAAARVDRMGDKTTTVAQKGDKLNRSEAVMSAKQTFRAPMTSRIGNREVIKTRQFTRVASNLSLTAGTYASDIPPFNPLRLYAEQGDLRSVELAPEIADADVSVVWRDLASIAVEASAPSLSDSDVLALIEEERRVFNGSGSRTSVPIPSQQMLSRTLRQPEGLGDALGYAHVPDDPFSTIEVRVVPENVTELPKLDQNAMPPLVEERDVVLSTGETLETVLRSYGATPEQIAGITSALASRVKIENMTEGHQLRILIAPGPRLGDPRQIVRVIALREWGIEGIAATTDRGVFVSVTPPGEDANRQNAGASREEGGGDEGRGGARLYESLYETGAKNDLPRELIEHLIQIFGDDVDLLHRVSSEDALEVLYGTEEEGDQKRPEILYASLTIGGEVKKVYHFASSDGSVRYLDEQGRSLRKFLLRKPVVDGELRSGFGARRHPILGYTKMHTGVDWANRTGTPILAAGDGTVIKAEWDGGYGRRIEIEHANGYVTAYSHQSRFNTGIRAGVKVRQGQVIGYVGNTGLSTGPHLHYEVLVNGRFIDALKIRVPRESELTGDALTQFEREREQIDTLVSRSTGFRAAMP
ncbi:M23 family metallopeptidase [Microvirga mediterraneensis]|jgi:murein DD-endopeptidase MepM/ murein hydrolase activator NlpD|uniref:M23 family metallopeptidase n=1 Tax=Microvirga mediterraneensis TaxID=2754695 RepID=A0A838BUW1_9HYPH|nr:M23 family metallopeptidase [Microvirga mediterraneensis]MBA1158872.1 M23 family metallopeptidase [Microvirga mediterraneensis]